MNKNTNDFLNEIDKKEIKHFLECVAYFIMGIVMHYIWINTEG